MASIQHALSRVKEDLPRQIESLVSSYLTEHPEYVWRCRQLDPLTLVLLFATQVLHGNTAITHLRHLVQPRPARARAHARPTRRAPPVTRTTGRSSFSSSGLKSSSSSSPPSASSRLSRRADSLQGSR